MFLHMRYTWAAYSNYFMGGGGGGKMSSISNIGGGIKDMAMSGFKGESMSDGFNQVKTGLGEGFKAAKKASGVAKSAIANGADSLVFNSAPVETFGKMSEVGGGESRGRLSEAEKAAGAVSRNFAHRPIDQNGNVISNEAVEAANNAIQVENMKKAFKSALSESGSVSASPDETHDSSQTVKNHVNRKHETEYSDSGPTDNSSGINGQDKTIQTVKNHVNRKHETEYSDSGPTDSSSGLSGQSRTEEGDPNTVHQKQKQITVIEPINPESKK